MVKFGAVGPLLHARLGPDRKEGWVQEALEFRNLAKVMVYWQFFAEPGQQYVPTEEKFGAKCCLT